MQTKTPKNSNEGSRLIGAMVENELLFAKLYKKHSLLYKNRDFWLSLAEEEVRHAEWLTALQKSRDVFSVRLDLLPYESVKLIGEEIESEILAKDFPSLPEALEKTLSLEKSFFEKNYFEFIAGDSVAIRRVMADLKAETAEHIFKVEEEIGRFSFN